MDVLDPAARPTTGAGGAATVTEPPSSAQSAAAGTTAVADAAAALRATAAAQAAVASVREAGSVSAVTARAVYSSAKAAAVLSHLAAHAAAKAARVAAEAAAAAAAAAGAGAGAGASEPTAAAQAQEHVAGTEPGSAIDSPRPEWAVFLADPVLPRFSPSLPADTRVSFASPAEQGLWRDISLVQRVAMQLRDSEAGFEALFDSAPTAMLVTELVEGHAGSVLRVNPSFTQLTGHPSIHLLGKDVIDLAPAGDRESLQEGTISSDVGSEPSDQVQRWVHADGHTMRVRLRTAVVRPTGLSGDRLVSQVEALPGH